MTGGGYKRTTVDRLLQFVSSSFGQSTSQHSHDHLHCGSLPGYKSLAPTSLLEEFSGVRFVGCDYMEADSHLECVGNDDGRHVP